MVDEEPTAQGQPRGQRCPRTPQRRRSNLTRAQRRRLTHTLRQLRPKRQLVVTVRGWAALALVIAVLVPWLLGVAALGRLVLGR